MDAIIRTPQDLWEVNLYRRHIEDTLNSMGNPGEELRRMRADVREYLGGGKYRIHAVREPESFDMATVFEPESVSGWVALIQTDRSAPYDIEYAWQFDGDEEYRGGDSPLSNACVLLMAQREGIEA